MIDAFYVCQCTVVSFPVSIEANSVSWVNWFLLACHHTVTK